MKNIIILLILTINSLTASPLVQPKEKLEWGAGVLTMRANHYRGSDQAKNYFYPLPYFIYTTEKVEAEPSFIRATFFKNNWFAFKLSVLVGLNVESESNIARQGMPDLDYTFEAGPMAIFYLYQSKNKIHNLTFEFPFRSVQATDLTYIDTIGFFGIPFLNYIIHPNSSTYHWGVELSFASMWGSKDYHNHFYQVLPEFETSTRNQYSSKSGYSGVQTTLVLNKRWKNFVFVPFFRWDNLKNAAFRHSPLFKKSNYFVGGMGFFWLFGG